jgi:fibronectin-binding autotransporter adhesin
VNSITYDPGAAVIPIGLRTSGAGGTAANLTFKTGNTGISVQSANNQNIGISDGLIVLADDLSVMIGSTGSLTISRPITGAFALTKTGTGTGELILSSANTFSGTTTISDGLLTLSNALALQNSAIDTTNSILGSTSAGLKTTVTTLDLGGLTGNKDFADVFTTSSGGYNSVTALTLKPGTGVTRSYSGAIADGATGMTLTKSGAGNQILSGTNSYIGATSITAGTLKINGNQSAATGAVTVAAGATLAGSGTIGGATSFAADPDGAGSAVGGIHSAGDGVGKQSFTSTVNYSAGSIFAWDLGASPAETTITKDGGGLVTGSDRGTAYDAVNVAGALSGTDAIFRVVLSGSQTFGDTFWTTDRQWTDIFRTADHGLGQAETPARISPRSSAAGSNITTPPVTSETAWRGVSPSPAAPSPGPPYRNPAAFSPAYCSEPACCATVGLPNPA